MPKTHEEDLIARDADLPGLATILDPSVMAAQLAEADSELGDQLGARDEKLELQYLRYKPGTNCLAGYRLGAGADARVFYAKAYAEGAQAKLDKAEAKAEKRQGLRRIRVDRLGLVLFEFPDDAKLDALQKLAQPELRQRLLARTLGDDSIGEGDELETLAYKPERRYVARLVRADDGEQIVFKFYSPERYRAARKAHRALGAVPQEVLLQRQCGGSKSYEMLAFGWLKGPTLREALETEAPVDMEAVGASIARLHAQTLAKLAQEGEPKTGDELGALAGTLGFLLPDLADTAGQLAAQIAEEITRVRSETGEELGLLHGDLYDKQIVLTENGAGLIDLDDARMGDPRRDLGLWIAHLERDRIMGRGLPALDGLVGTFLEGYQRVRGRPLAGLTPFVAEGLFRLAHHPFRRQSPDWPSQSQEIVERTRALLAENAHP
jgi:aminoglycoside phosphotransferase (APT) family kinase protein